MQFSKFSSKDDGGEVGMSYDSPITIMTKQMQNQIENGIFKAVQDVGIFVDKVELVRALRYDRHQYEKGYNDRDAEIVRCENCKHSEPWYGDKCRCFLWNETGIDVFDDGYCNYGKHKEGR